MKWLKTRLFCASFFAEAYRVIAYAYFEQYCKAYRKLILEKKEDEKALAMLEDLRLFRREKVKETCSDLIRQFLENQ